MDLHTIAGDTGDDNVVNPLIQAPANPVVNGQEPGRFWAILQNVPSHHFG
jgi:hypothetical protein